MQPRELRARQYRRRGPLRRAWAWSRETWATTWYRLTKRKAATATTPSRTEVILENALQTLAASTPSQWLRRGRGRAFSTWRTARTAEVVLATKNPVGVLAADDEEPDAGESYGESSGAEATAHVVAPYDSALVSA